MMLIAALAVCAIACGSKSNITVPGDPTGDVDKDAKVLADYLTVVVPLINDVTNELTVYMEKYQDDAEFEVEKATLVQKLEKDTNLDCHDLVVPADPTGDAKKDAETFANATIKLEKLTAEFTTTFGKYMEYYGAKSEAESEKFADAVDKQLPENVKKILNGE